ncbi:MAG: hypothetical protein H0X24_19330 [Ktedonobacterales bacterium]|nr:hypothetical protein [Ktedonobacterales bacterium]
MAEPLARWLTLYDECERTYNARDHPAVDKAFAALYAHDHTLTARDRMAARIARWRRDSPDEPLPDERDWWGHCLCRTCAAARLAQVGSLAPWQRQQKTLTTQRKKEHIHVWNG